MTLFIYNTLTRKKEAFIPHNPEQVGLYVCGPTVYDFAHIGNARPVVVFDVLTRLLRRLYPAVRYVRNITDVDDKINAAAARNGESIQELTQRTAIAYTEDMARIGALPPDIEPRATAHIPDMIHMIALLIQQEHAYEAEGHVLFRVASFPEYGAFSRRNRDEMLAGARVEVAPYKQDPGDFVLWKPSDQHTPGWESPWGFGRPGWHIECSAMSHRYLGPVFDIHGGGQDLTFPHHENEIAQSRCAHGASILARYWMHNGHLTVQGNKMSKSLGNFFTVRDLLTNHKGEVVRWGLLSTHYRQPLDWTQTTLDQARQSLDRLYAALRSDESLNEQEEVEARVMTALLNDLNIPLAIAHLHDLATTIHQTADSGKKRHLRRLLKASGNLLGFLNESPDAWFQQGVTQGAAESIEALIQARHQARARKDFAESDRIRDNLIEQGIILEDGTGGTTWRHV